MDSINGEWVVNTKVVYSEHLEDESVSENIVKKSFNYSGVMLGNGIIQFGI